MLSDEEIEILSLLDSQGALHFDTSVPDTMRVLRLLQARGYVAVFFDGITDFTAEGKIALADSKQLRQQMADQRAKEAEAKAAKDAEVIINREKQFRHDFKVAAFTVILTLLLEHLPDIYKLIMDAFKSSWLLLFPH